MPPVRRRFRRQTGQRRYRKIFVIVVEGRKTELQYFAIFRQSNPAIHIQCLKGKHSASPSLLQTMEDRLETVDLKKSDEAWIVVDKDQWAKKADNFGFALSNPKFEYWLLLHFEDGKGCNSSQVCTQKLRSYFPDNDKGIDARETSKDKISDAIRRAKQKDNPPCEDWPRTTGTTVYKLAQKIL